MDYMLICFKALFKSNLIFNFAIGFFGLFLLLLLALSFLFLPFFVQFVRASDHSNFYSVYQVWVRKEITISCGEKKKKSAFTFFKNSSSSFLNVKTDKVYSNNNEQGFKLL